jgi:hypothetical protein
MNSVRSRLQELIEEGNLLREEGRNKNAMKDHEREAYLRKRTRWQANCDTALRFAGLKDHRGEFQRLVDSNAYEAMKISLCVAQLESAIDSIDSGFVGNLRHLLHAELFDSTIEQARSLLSAGHRIPAAVLGRIVIESWLRDKAEACGMPKHDKSKPSILNDALKKAGEFSVPKWRQIQGYLDIGNAAAHGKEADISDKDVERLLEFAETTCT